MNAALPPAADAAHLEALALMQRRFDRERAARKAAEQLLTSKSRELFDALQVAQDSEHRLQMALWASGEGIWDWSSEDGVMRVRGLVVGGIEQPAYELAGREVIERIEPEDREATLLAWRLHLSGTHADIDTAYRVRMNDEVRWVRIRGRAMAARVDGMPVHVTGTIKDITVQRAAEESLHTMAQAFASTHDALAVVDGGWRVVEANQSMQKLTGLSQQALLGFDLLELIDLPALGDSAQRIERQLETAGGMIPVEVTVTPVGGETRCGIVAMRDIRERRLAEERLERMALQDALTALPNRAALEQHLARCVKERLRTGFGLLFLDLDGFKGVNDSFGHGEGDQLLREVSRRLRQALPQAFIGRWGGDEFAIVLPDGTGDFHIREAAQLLIATMALPFRVGVEHEMLISPSIGAVRYPEDGDDASTLLRKADAAMYRAKDSGKNCLRIFDPAIEEGAVRRVKLQSLLRVDAERNAFTFVAQPKFDRAGRHTSAEVLVRWNTREFGAVSPAEFIPIAEQSGTIELLGRHALHMAAHLAKQVEEVVGRPLPIAVNLSPRQLRFSGFERLAVHACERMGVHPSQLELELTESALASDAVLPLLQRLRQQGFSLSLDDFGTGYSSLSHLLHLPFQKVKIDRAFVMDMQANPRARAVIRGTLQICRDLGLTTVAEGVETEAQFQLLSELGVDEFQGYLFARPMPPEQWLALLAQGGADKALPR